MRSPVGPVVVVALFCGSPLVAQTPTPADGWMPVMQMQVVPSRTDGSPGTSTTSWDLVSGSTHRARVTAGQTLCQIGAGGGANLPPVDAAMPTLWQLSTDYLGEQDGRHQVRATTEFVRVDGQPIAAGPTVHTLSLREGDAVTLDVLRAQPGAACAVRLVRLDVRLTLRPLSAAAAAALYAADLWFDHTDLAGRQTTQKLTISLDSERPSPFTFNTLGFPIAKLDARQANADAFISISGTLRARTLPDGQVALDLGTTRLAGLRNPDRPMGTSPGPRGLKTIVVRADEATAIDLPVPGGSSMMALPGESLGSGGIGVGGAGARAGGMGRAGQGLDLAQLQQAITVLGQALAMRNDLFFQGHRTQLIVRLRRVN